jgi:hypothetical protein
MTGSLRHRLLLLGCLATFAACSGSDAMGPVRAAFDEAGHLHVAVRTKTGQDEGGGWSYKGFYYGVLEAETWRWESIPLDDQSTGTSFGRVYYLSASEEDHALIVADSLQGVQAFEVWGEAPKNLRLADSASDALDSDTRRILRSDFALNAAWFGADGTARILAGDRLFELQDGLVTRAIPTDGSCAMTDRNTYEDCMFHPTGDRSGEAAIMAWQEKTHDEISLRSLSCSNQACIWQEVPGQTLGTRDPGGSSNALRRSFLHLSDGTPLFVRPVNMEGVESYALLASTPAADRILIPGNTHFAGAAARPTGGYVAVGASYDDKVTLVIVDGDGMQRSLDLGGCRSGKQRDPLSVVVKGSGEEEEAHVLLSDGASSILYIVVDLVTGLYERRGVDF